MGQKNLGWNQIGVAAFDAALPTTTHIERAETNEERAQGLAASGQTARAAGLYRNFGL